MCAKIKTRVNLKEPAQRSLSLININNLSAFKRQNKEMRSVYIFTFYWIIETVFSQNCLVNYICIPFLNNLILLILITSTLIKYLQYLHKSKIVWSSTFIWFVLPKLIFTINNSSKELLKFICSCDWLSIILIIF